MTKYDNPVNKNNSLFFSCDDNVMNRRYLLDCLKTITYMEAGLYPEICSCDVKFRNIKAVVHLLCFFPGYGSGFEYLEPANLPLLRLENPLPLGWYIYRESLKEAYSGFCGREQNHLVLFCVIKVTC